MNLRRTPECEHAHPSQGVFHTWPPWSQPSCWLWLAGALPLYCYFTALPLRTASPSRSKDRCTVCSRPELLGAEGGTPAFPAWTWNLHIRHLSQHYNTSPVVHAVFHPARGPSRTLFLCLGLDRHLAIHSEQSRGLALPYLNGKHREGCSIFCPLCMILVCVVWTKEDSRNNFYNWGM